MIQHTAATNARHERSKRGAGGFREREDVRAGVGIPAQSD